MSPASFLAGGLIVLLSAGFLSPVAAVSESRPVRGFTGVKAGAALQVSIDISGKEGVRVEAPDSAALALVETVVSNGVLEVRFKNSAAPINGRLNVFIDAITISSLEAGGSSSITMLKASEAPQIDVTSYGAGRMTLLVKTSSVNINVDGSSIVAISGSSLFGFVTTRGATQVNGAGLQVDSAQVYVHGAGKVELGVGTSVSGFVEGAGVLRIKGNPMEQVQTSGGGRVEHFV